MIKIRGLKKKLGDKEVLKGVDLDIYDGEIFTLLGGSGEGKSVFLKNIIGLIKPDEGSVEIDGEEITQLSYNQLLKVQVKVGMMFQGGALFDSLSVGENVAFGLKRLTSYNEDEIERLVRKYLKMVRLERVEDELPEKLSIGMKRRVALARAIATQPKYVFYDEPTTGLDPIITEAVCDIFLELRKELNVTSVIVTHELETAFKVSDRVGLLYNGVIREVETIEKFKKSDDPYVKEFIKGFREA
ncbi:MAG: ABC transporter ATP-binding protein [Elusimicrobiota bacterium]